MNPTPRIAGIAVIGLLLALGACSGGGSDGDAGGTGPPAPTGIGRAGGTVLGPNGTKVEIPPGALATDTPIAIGLSSTGVPALPAGFTAVGPRFALTPHGTTFAVPVTVTVPFDPALVPAGRQPELLKTNAQNLFEVVANALVGSDVVTAEITSFSDEVVVIPPLEVGEPIRSWSFREFRGDSLEEVEVAFDTQIGGDLEEIFDFGPANFDPGITFDDGTTLEPDGIASGDIAGINNGVTYWVGASAPLGNAALENDPIGGKARLLQFQTFTKNAANAKYEFTVSDAFIEVFDGNGSLQRTCPDTHDLIGVACDLIKGEVYLDVKAYTSDPNTPFVTFFRTAGGALLNGSGGAFLDHAWNKSVARTPLWASKNFDVTKEDFNGPNGHVLMELGIDRIFRVDLSAVEEGHQFTVKVEAHASTYNRAASAVSGEGAEFETAVNAWLRDPATIGGTTVTTSGLTAIPTPFPLVEPVETPVEPAACEPGPGPDPAAGVLEFSSASYAIAEADATPAVAVTRTGGTTGAVTATFTTSDGTALGGTDYTQVSGSVFFADGDNEARVIEVPIIQDAIGGEGDRTVNLALSQPGGCAALGTQITAVLTIRDDDPAPPARSGLDLSFGTEGLATTTAFGGDRSAMALQADGKIVMVGGTFVDFVLARFNADGTLDPSFGGGQITTDMVSDEQEEALGVAIQADGKIVVVGYTGQATGGSVFALARYLANGSLDPTFGVGGKVVTGVDGQAFAVAVQPDGRIVASGRVNDDIQVARYDTDGSLDETFGVNGRVDVQVDIFGDTDAAANLVLLPDGAIVVSGNSAVGGGAESTGLARYTASGRLDFSFGVEGIVALAGRSVGEGLALQSDGKLVLVGRVETAVPPATSTQFAVMRLNADGTVDEDFGTEGAVATAISTRGDGALAVTLQGDGRIVAAGSSSNQVNPNFAVARYDTDGTLDTEFGNDGVLVVDFFGFADIAESVAVQADGKIVLGGLARDNVDGYGLARVLP